MPSAQPQRLGETQRVQVARQLGSHYGERLTPFEARKGRGAGTNASGRFEAYAREAFDDGWDRNETIEPLRLTLYVQVP